MKDVPRGPRNLRAGRLPPSKTMDEFAISKEDVRDLQGLEEWEYKKLQAGALKLDNEELVLLKTKEQLLETEEQLLETEGLLAEDEELLIEDEEKELVLMNTNFTEDELSGQEYVNDDGNLIISFDQDSYNSKYYNINPTTTNKPLGYTEEGIIDDAFSSLAGEEISEDSLALVYNGDDSDDEERRLAILHDSNHDERKLKVDVSAVVAVIQASIDFALFCHSLGVFGNPSNDDAHFILHTGKQSSAGGNSISVAYHLANGSRHNDNLGSAGVNTYTTSREDLDSWAKINVIELYRTSVDDICIQDIGVISGPEPSGTSRKEYINIPGWLIYALTDGKRSGTDKCMWFGDELNAITNFQFRWSEALSCYKRFGDRKENYEAYYNCFYDTAMKSFDYQGTNGNIFRHDWSRNRPPKVPLGGGGGGGGGGQYRQLKVNGKCAGTLNEGRSNGTRVLLESCRPGASSQLWTKDSRGRIVNRYANKCMEAGSNVGDKLYAKQYIWDCHSGLHQIWHQTSDGRIRNHNVHDKYLGVAYCDDNRNTPWLEYRNREIGGQCGSAQSWSMF